MYWSMIGRVDLFFCGDVCECYSDFEGIEVNCSW